MISLCVHLSKLAHYVLQFLRELFFRLSQRLSPALVHSAQVRVQPFLLRFEKTTEILGA